MTSSCKIKLYDKPILLELDDLDGSHLDVFFAYGIVNPFGPTLNFVTTASSNEEELSIPIIRVMLNPFQQVVYQIGTFMIGEEWNPIEDFLPLIDQSYGDCPTLILVTKNIDEDTRNALTKRMFQSFGKQVLQVYKSISTHYADPWTRVSQALAGFEYDSEGLNVDNTAKELATIVLKSEHVQTELQALFDAWEGSIEKTGIQENMKNAAMSEKVFRELFLNRLVPSLWLPNFTEKELEEPITGTTERLKIESLEHMFSILESEDWKTYKEDHLAELFRCLNYAYGQKGEAVYVKWLTALYHQILEIGINADTRLILEEELLNPVGQGKCHHIVFLPFLVADNNHQVVARASIDFVSTSDYYDGELYAFTELRTLFQQNSLVNRGAVFGALITIGDEQSINFAKELTYLLTPEEIKSASRVHTQHLNHLSIQFWIEWAKSLVKSIDPMEQTKFGNCATALTLGLQYEQFGEVVYGKRNYPCHLNDEPITQIKKWSIDEYAKIIADDLYEIESLETAPKLFSDVLRHWGLMPNAPLMEQYIPNVDDGQVSYKKLLDPTSKLENPQNIKFLDKFFK